MNTIKKILTLIAVLIIPIILMSCSDKIIQPDQLPDNARSFIQQYFPGINISYVKLDSELMKKTFDVRLENGTELEFNGKGEWDSIDCKHSAVPAELVNDAIAEYIQSNFSTQYITKIDKEAYGYEIELSNDLELKFDKAGRLIAVDD